MAAPPCGWRSWSRKGIWAGSPPTPSRAQTKLGRRQRKTRPSRQSKRRWGSSTCTAAPTRFPSKAPRTALGSAGPALRTCGLSAGVRSQKVEKWCQVPFSGEMVSGTLFRRNGVRYPFQKSNSSVVFRHGKSKAGRCRRYGLPRPEPGELSFSSFQERSALSRFSRPGGRELGFGADARAGLLPDAEPLAYGALSPRRRRPVEIPAKDHSDPHAALSRPNPNRGIRPYLPRQIQVAPRRTGQPFPGLGSLRGKKRPASGLGEKGGGVAMVQRLRAPLWKRRPKAAAQPVAGPRAGPLSGVA